MFKKIWTLDMHIFVRIVWLCWVLWSKNWAIYTLFASSSIIRWRLMISLITSVLSGICIWQSTMQYARAGLEWDVKSSSSNWRQLHATTRYGACFPSCLSPPPPPPPLLSTSGSIAMDGMRLEALLTRRTYSGITGIVSNHNTAERIIWLRYSWIRVLLFPSIFTRWERARRRVNSTNIVAILPTCSNYIKYKSMCQINWQSASLEIGDQTRTFFFLYPQQTG